MGSLLDRQIPGVENLPVYVTPSLPSFSVVLLSVRRVPLAGFRVTGQAKPKHLGERERLGTFVPNTRRLVSPVVIGKIQMTFLPLSVRGDEGSVRPDESLGVKVECCTPSEKNPPVPVTDGRYILVDEWERRVTTGRRPQSRRKRTRCVCVCTKLPASWCERVTQN